MKIFSIAFAGLITISALTSLSATAADVKTVAAINKDNATLVGKTISAQGKVVKVNNGIMGRNFVHVQDGTGDAKTNTNNLIITSKQTAQVGDQVTISGVVVLNRDFGSGYMYPLLIEDATIAAKK
jgi:hypothetical protein